MKRQTPKKTPAAVRKLRLAAFRARAAIEPAMAAVARFVVDAIFSLKGNASEAGRGTINRVVRETREAEHRKALYADTPQHPTFGVRQRVRALERYRLAQGLSAMKALEARQGGNSVWVRMPERSA